jgi:PAS domain S-box-containing protein
MVRNRIAASSVSDYAVALAVSLLAAILATILSPELPEIPFLLSIFAVVISSLYGGRGPGLLATVLGALVSIYLTVPHANVPGVEVAVNLLWFDLTVLIMFLISSLNAVRRRGQEALLRLAAIVESSDDAIFGQSLDGTITSWNSGAERMYGLTAGEAVGRPSSILLPAERAGEFAQSLEHLSGGDHFDHFETRHRRKDGREIDVSLAISPITQARGKVVGFSTIARDIGETKKIQAERERLFDEVSAGAQRLQILSKQLMAAQERERRLIATEMHDEIGQALTAVKINLQAARRMLSGQAHTFADRAARAEGMGGLFASPAGLDLSLEESIGLVERTLEQVRDLSLDLRPSLLDDLGLVAALRWYVDRASQRSGVPAEFTSDLEEAGLVPEIEIACFRIAQESLTNIARHAEAKHIRVAVRDRSGAIELSIRDDGVGFDVQAAQERAARGASMGLLGMQERAFGAGGQLDIRSAPGAGTEVLASFPRSQPNSILPS